MKHLLRIDWKGGDVEDGPRSFCCDATKSVCEIRAIHYETGVDRVVGGDVGGVGGGDGTALWT